MFCAVWEERRLSPGGGMCDRLVGPDLTHRSDPAHPHAAAQRAGQDERARGKHRRRWYQPHFARRLKGISTKRRTARHPAPTGHSKAHTLAQSTPRSGNSAIRRAIVCVLPPWRPILTPDPAMHAIRRARVRTLFPRHHRVDMRAPVAKSAPKNLIRPSPAQRNQAASSAAPSQTRLTG